MPKVRQLLPRAEPVDAHQLADEIREASRSFTPFDQRVTSFVSDLARHLRTEDGCRQVPAIAALAFWIRDASITRLQADWRAPQSLNKDVKTVPRGVVFHLPPTNVDTLFAYSWLMSALAGNGNIVRISPRATESDTPAVLRAIGDVLDDHPEVSSTMSFVQYDRDPDVTEQLSKSDVRVIWGGDETIRSIREIPLNPLASELAFADRFSMAAFDAQQLASLDDPELRELVRQFYNDSYWFDQMGCSSPRVVFWCGDDDACSLAERRFIELLEQRLALEEYESPVGAVMTKLVRSATMAADGSANSVAWSNPNLTIAVQPQDAPVTRDSPGSGMFSFRRIHSLNEIASVVDRRDQTLSVFGFEPKTLESLADQLNGAGIDRIVPVGGALQFDRHWDGWDLLDAFTRKISIGG